MKMRLQLYRVDDHTHLLDFMHLPTHPSEGLQVVGEFKSVHRLSNGAARASTTRGVPVDGLDGRTTSLTQTVEFFELCALFISELGK